MNKLWEAAENTGLPNLVVADDGRTEVSAGSKTVLAIGPGHFRDREKAPAPMMLKNGRFFA